MRLSPTRRLLLALAAAPLLSLAACGDSGQGPIAGEPIANIAPPAGQKWEDVVTEGTDGGMVLGNPQAPIKLVEYGSLSCPACARFAQEAMQPLIHDYISTGRVSLEFRSFTIHQAMDIPLTALVRCAPKEAFFPLVEQIYANFQPMNEYIQQPEVQQAAEAATKLGPAERLPALAQALGYTQFFSSRGVSADQARTCLSNMDSITRISDNSKKYSANGVSGTPTFELNGNRLPADAISWAKISEALRQAGAR